MIRLEGSVEILRPVEIVFDFLSRVENYPSWQPGIAEAQQTSTGAVGLGSTMRLAFLGPGDRRMAATAEVTEFQRPTRFAYRTTSGPAKVSASYDYRATEGGTLVVVRSDLQPTGALRFLEGLLAGQVKAEFPVSLQRLKRVLEGGGR